MYIHVLYLHTLLQLHHAVRLDDLQNGYRYRLIIWTGAARHAGTESTVAFKLFGDAANSDVRVVNIAEKVRTSNFALASPMIISLPNFPLKIYCGILLLF